MIELPKCRGVRSSAGLDPQCLSCGRYAEDPAGRVVIPTFRAEYANGVTSNRCDDWQAKKRRPSVGRVIGVALFAAVCAVYSVGARASCAWADPGSNPYTGDKATAVRKLSDIPAGTRERLAELVEARAGRHVVVTRDQIDGGRYVGMRDMNFGSGRICPGAVDRSMWPVNHQEGAMVFQEGKYAVLWFSRCGNVAWAEDLKARPSMSQLQDQADAIKAMGVRTVSEPGTLAMIGAALISIFIAMRKVR